MATPHMSGVLAALYHRNPALTAYEARDLVLDPRSYDPLTDTKANTSVYIASARRRSIPN